MFGEGDKPSKTFSNLPSHWSLSIRFDLLLFSSLATSDKINVLIDNVNYG